MQTNNVFEWKTKGKFGGTLFVQRSMKNEKVKQPNFQQCQIKFALFDNATL
jgi:hypothetical protein